MIDTSTLTPEQRKYLERVAVAYDFAKSNDNIIVSKELSMAYLCFSVGFGYVDDAMDILTRRGMEQGKLKTYGNNLRQSFDAFDGFIRHMLTDDSVRMALCYDYDDFQRLCDHFMLMKHGPEYYISDGVEPYSDRNEDYAD